jgi:hypothetical protein
MTTYKGYDPVAWQRPLHTTLAQHIRQVEPSMVRNYQMGALLEATGRILKSLGGNGFDWPVQFRYHDVEGNTGRTVRNFAQTNIWDTASLPYRGYQTTDAIYRAELLANRGPEAIINVFNGFTGRLTGSMQNALGRQYYIDGETSANSKFWHGFDSVFQHSGNTVNITDGTSRSVNAADKVAFPEGTYAGLNIELGAAHGGENASGAIWPDGIADSQFDFWTPIIVHLAHTAFASALDEALRYGIITCQRNASQNAQITNIFLARDQYEVLLNVLDDKERLIIGRGAGAYSLPNFGFRQVINFDGVEVSWEAGVPTGTGYGMNYNDVEMRCRESDFLTPEGPVYDIFTQAYNAVVYTLSNLKFGTPRNMLKFETVA